MSTVFVDSKVLLDVMSDDPVWSAWSAAAMAEAANRHRLVINAAVYAEVSVRFSRIEDLNAALPPDLIEREAIPFAAAFLAGKAFHADRKRGGSKVSCLPDFFIGAHAAIAGYTLLTRDAARYRTYFPKLALITPPPHTKVRNR